MDFSTEDISRLYGQYLFVVAQDDLTEIEQASEIKNENYPEPADDQSVLDFSIVTSGSAIDWKLKQTSQLVLVLSQKEFTDKSLTGFLKQCIIEAAVNTDQVGFGILDPTAESWNFSDLPVSFAWVFGTTLSPQTITLNDNTLFIHPPLAGLLEDGEKKKALIQQLQAFAKK
ncbi:MAG: hypothetical protein R3D00_24515 [Bacteroidia bacterium]